MDSWRVLRQTDDESLIRSNQKWRSPQSTPSREKECGGKKDEVMGILSGNTSTLEKRCGQHQLMAKGSEME